MKVQGTKSGATDPGVSTNHSRGNLEVIRTLLGEAVEVKSTPYGSVGIVYSSSELEVVWVSKKDEEIDPEWYSQPTVDLIVVLQGKLRVEFALDENEPLTLEPGDFLVIPPETKCRAYRWPRETPDTAVFLAIYPQKEKKIGPC